MLDGEIHARACVCVFCCSFPGPANIIYRIEAEKFTGSKVSRIEFKEASSIEDGLRYFLERPLTLHNNIQNCVWHTAYINV